MIPTETIPICPECKSELTVEETEFFTVKICEACLQFTEIRERQICCSIPDLIPKRLLTSNGSYHVRHQCNNCGFVSSNSLPGFSVEDKNKLPVVNTLNREARYEKISDFRQQAYKKVSDLKEARRQQQIKEYRDDYLQSREWQQKRLLVLERDNYICQSCRAAGAKDVHHLTYEHIRNEPLFDLVSVCRRCHEAIEEMKTGIQSIKIVH